MAVEKMIGYLNRLYPLGRLSEDSIRNTVSQVVYKRGQILASPGKRADEIWYLVNGLAREYYYETDGRVSVTAFWKENELMLIAESFFRNKPSDRYIDLIEDSSLLTAGVNEVYSLQNEFPQIHCLGYSILSLAKQKSDERSALLMLNAKERYIQFCEHFPWTRIPVADAASYLGLRRETLSKIRSGK